MATWNKLVRDRIPNIIEDSGKTAVIRKLNTVEYVEALKNKLSEEVQELTAATGSDIVSEVADVLEVLSAYCEVCGIDATEIERVRLDKSATRGKFVDRIFLIETYEAPH